MILEKGVFPNVRVNFLSLTCCHCAKPACIDVCPGNAIQKREEDGIVVVDRKKCWGRDACGGRCYDACPYGAPQFGKEENAKMEKCDYCIDRLYKGKTPICVSCCPCRALDAGPLEELRRRYGDLQEAKGFVYHSEVKPSVIFRRKLGSSG